MIGPRLTINFLIFNALSHMRHYGLFRLFDLKVASMAITYL